MLLDELRCKEAFALDALGPGDTSHVLREATTAKFPPLVTIGARSYIRYECHGNGHPQVTLPAAGYLKLRGGLVSGSGLILTSALGLIEASPIPWNRVKRPKSGLVPRNDLIGNWPTGRQALSDGVVAFESKRPSIFLGALNVSHYSHFLLEAYSRLSYLRKSGIDLDDVGLILPDGPLTREPSSHMRKMLRYAGFDDEKITLLPPRAWARCAEVIVPLRAIDLEQGRCFVDPGSLSVYKALARTAIAHATPRHSAKKIYVSRKEADTRIITNEDKIEAHLAARGYQVIYPGTMTLEEKVAAFRNAEIVVGAVGNGMVNTVFSRRRTQFLFLSTHFLERTCLYHSMLCSAKKQKHCFLFEREFHSPPGKHSYQPHGHYSKFAIGEIDYALSFLGEP